MFQTNTALRKAFFFSSLALGTVLATVPAAEARYCPIHDPIALLHAILYGPGPEDPAQYVHHERFIVHGKLDIDPERTVESRTGRGIYYLKGYLTGKSLTEDGFVNSFEAPVLMKSYCETVSCEFLSDEVLVYIYRVRGRFQIFNDFACNLGVYRKPDQETLDGMVSCLRGEGCPVTDDWYGVGD
ncbi:hypothetical protein [Aliiroseovarius marinus]|uniref:hypothetical protein n=1 Tax=Aliiroseovarius marinus TaxID=2500159 RepID=UPI00249411A5|nr:hypothetical protein [Aliiroseovarius marinus]